jgi:transposase-like protein
MAPAHVDDQQIFDVLSGDRELADLWQDILNQTLQAEMSEHLQADRYEQTEEREGYRHGSYERKLTTRVGRLTLEVPRCQDGSFSTELFERYQRSEKALVLALQQMVVQGVSTRRVKKITTELCGYDFTKSTVSRLTKQLDEQVRAWAERPLEGDYPFVIADAMHIKVRRQGAVRSTSVLIAVGITESGQREILGLKVALSETGEAWGELFDDLKNRGLSGVELVTSDAHQGLRDAAESRFPGCIWQRCQAHYRRQLLDETPEKVKEAMLDLLDEVLEATSPVQARRVFEEILDGERQRLVEIEEDGETEEVDTYETLREEAAPVLARLEEDLEEVTAVLALPSKYRRRLRTTNMLERLIEEVRRREKVIRIFPNRKSAWRLIGALLAEYHEEWSTGRRYLKMEAFEEWKDELSNPEPTEEREPIAAI